MVELSRSIANKIKDKHGDITEDEVRGPPWKSMVDAPEIALSGTEVHYFREAGVV